MSKLNVISQFWHDLIQKWNSENVKVVPGIKTECCNADIYIGVAGKVCIKCKKPVNEKGGISV